MTHERDKLRQMYWDHKHSVPEWCEDIHFGDFAPSTRDLEVAADDNNHRMITEVLEAGSVYILGNKPRMLDFGCGVGELLREFARISPSMTGVGIDLSDVAIQKAQKYANEHHKLNNGLEWIVGGVDALRNLMANGGQFDAIICRDAYYMLDESEQQIFWNCCSGLLRRNGVILLADMVVHDNALGEIQSMVVDRQFAGVPIRWTKEASSKTEQFSVFKQAASAGFDMTDVSQSYDYTSVSASYSAAAHYAASAKTAKAYNDIVALCQKTIDGKAQFHHRTFVAKWRTPLRSIRDLDHHSDADIGITFSKNLSLGDASFLQGEWKFPANKWSLLLGRSGSGKTTILSMIAGLRSLPGVQRTASIDRHRVFLVQQDAGPIRGISVLANVKLFNSSELGSNRILSALGIDSDMYKRRFDRNFSGGEARRILLAQALAADPTLLLLDEPCAGLDVLRRSQFMYALRRGSNIKRAADGPSRKLTLVCADHNFFSIEHYFDHVFEIAGGCLIQIR